MNNKTYEDKTVYSVNPATTYVGLGCRLRLSLTNSLSAFYNQAILYQNKQGTTAQNICILKK